MLSTTALPNILSPALCTAPPSSEALQMVHIPQSTPHCRVFPGCYWKDNCFLVACSLRTLRFIRRQCFAVGSDQASQTLLEESLCVRLSSKHFISLNWYHYCPNYTAEEKKFPENAQTVSSTVNIHCRPHGTKPHCNVSEQQLHAGLCTGFHEGYYESKRLSPCPGANGLVWETGIHDINTYMITDCHQSMEERKRGLREWHRDLLQTGQTKQASVGSYV